MKVFDSLKEAVEYSKLIPWKVKICSQGEKCWCRMIVPKEPIQYKYNDYLEEFLSNLIDSLF